MNIFLQNKYDIFFNSIQMLYIHQHNGEELNIKGKYLKKHY